MVLEKYKCKNNKNNITRMGRNYDCVSFPIKYETKHWTKASTKYTQLSNINSLICIHVYIVQYK